MINWSKDKTYSVLMYLTICWLQVQIKWSKDKTFCIIAAKEKVRQYLLYVNAPCNKESGKKTKHTML